MITATYRYLVDWDSDGDFDLPLEEISSYVFEASWETGRDFASQMSGRSKAGSSRIVLDLQCGKRIGGTSCLINGENSGCDRRGPPCVPFLGFG